MSKLDFIFEMITYLISNNFPLHHDLLVAAILIMMIEKAVTGNYHMGGILQEFALKINQCKQIQIIRDTVRPGAYLQKSRK